MKKIILIFLIIFMFVGVNRAYEISDYYDSSDLSDYFGTMKACTNDNSDDDCRNGNEYKFYLKMYDLYYLYQNKYKVTLDLPLIMAALYYNNEELPTVFANNLNRYDRNSLKNENQITNLDWEYDFKNDPCYTYLNANDFSYDMQILAKNMVKKSITYKCKKDDSEEKNEEESNEESNDELKAEDIEKSNYSKETLKCEDGEYDKESIKESYELDLKKYKDFLIEYVKLKYHTPGTEIQSCSTGLGPNNSASTVVSKTGKEAIDKMTEIALAEADQVNAGGAKYWGWFNTGGRVEWCAAFTSWLFNQIGGIDKYIKSSLIAGEIPRASVAAGYGTWYEDECTDPRTVPAAGDVIVFDPYVGGYTPWPANGNDKYYSSHVGYVYAVDDTYVYTVEGNSGDAVRKKQYNRKTHCGTYGLQGINGYFRPNY